MNEIQFKNGLFDVYDETFSEPITSCLSRTVAQYHLDDYIRVHLDGLPPIHMDNCNGVKWESPCADIVYLPDGRVLARLCD